MDVLPDSYIEVIFNFGNDCHIDDAPLPPCYAANLLEKPFRLSTSGVLKTIGVRFFAWGFSALTGISLNKCVQPLADDWQQLRAGIEHVGDDEAVAKIQDHLKEYVSGAEQGVQSDAQQNPAQMLFASGGDIKIADLADDCHLSRRQLERKFQDAVGMSPKTLARRMRFEKVRDRLCGEPETDFLALALEYGFADQAHLSREFKYFSNRTLGEFQQQIRFMHAPLRYGVGFP